MSEVMLEVMDIFVIKYGYTLEMGGKFLKSRAKLYATAILDGVAPLDLCIECIECTRSSMCRPGGQGSYQRAVYYGPKKFNASFIKRLKHRMV